MATEIPGGCAVATSGQQGTRWEGQQVGAGSPGLARLAAEIPTVVSDPGEAG